MEYQELIAEPIKSALPDAEVFVKGDGRHFEVVVVSDAFCDKTIIAQHQMIYQALGDKVGNEIHALSIKTYNNTEWKKQ